LLLLDSGSGRCDKSIGALFEGYSQPLCMRYLHLHLLCDSIRIYGMVRGAGRGARGRGSGSGALTAHSVRPRESCSHAKLELRLQLQLRIVGQTAPAAQMCLCEKIRAKNGIVQIYFTVQWSALQRNMKSCRTIMEKY